MEAAIQENGKGEHPLPFTPNGSMENDDQPKSMLKNGSIESDVQPKSMLKNGPIESDVQPKSMFKNGSIENDDQPKSMLENGSMESDDQPKSMLENGPIESDVQPKSMFKNGSIENDDQPKSMLENGSMESDDQPKSMLENESKQKDDQPMSMHEITGEPSLAHQSAILTSDSTPSSTWKTASSFQATTNNLKDLLSMNEVVRQSLINDNWKIVESRKSRMVSTLPRYSRRSMVPPLLAHHDRISESLFSSNTIITTSSTSQLHTYRNQNGGQNNGSVLSRSTDSNFNYNEKSDEVDFQTAATNAKSASRERDNFQGKVRQKYHSDTTTTKKNTKQRSFNNSLDDDDEDDDDEVNFQAAATKAKSASRERENSQGKVRQNYHSDTTAATKKNTKQRSFNNSLDDNDEDDDDEVNFQAAATKAKSASRERENSQGKVRQNYHSDTTATTKKNTKQRSFNNSFDDDDNEDDDDDDDLFSITLRKKRNVPLPAFGDSDDGEENSECEDLVPYTSQWSMKDKGSLSFYDNLMDLDIKKPLYMLVPDSLGNSTPRVGELELDQLSDLSENEAKSNEFPLSDTDDDSSRRSNPRKLSRKDSSMQTDEPFTVSRMKEAGTMTAADIIAEIEAERSGNPRLRSFIPLPTKSTEGGEVDPKFTKRPSTYFEVLEGETISITCQLNGSSPIDVFWFRDMEEVTQLEEDDRCDIVHSGDTFTLMLFDTTKKDDGQYLCIGVNAQGHCVQGFQVNIQDNKNQGISPSFLEGLVNVEAFKGDKVTFGCKVTGYPPPRVQWYHKGERCRDGRTYQIGNDGSGGHRLVVRDVGETNTLFSAVARNVNGDEISTAEVNIKEKDVENTKTSSLSSMSTLSSLYPDVDELVQIAQKVSSTSSEIAPSRTTSRTFSFTPDKTLDESPLKREKERTHSNNKEPVPQFKAWRESNEVFLPLPEKNNIDISDEEQELNVSYPEFERLFEAQLISRSQLHSGRVWKKDLAKIQAFLKKISTTDGKKPREVETNDDVQLRINCGLKSVNPNFYRRDYVISVDSSGQRNSESHDHENQQTAVGYLRSNSVTSNSKSVKLLPHSLDSISFHDRNDDRRNRHQITNATKERSGVGLHSSDSVDRRSSEGDHDGREGDEFVMPCVKELLNKFGGPMSPEAPKDEVSPLKRVYSLTGRSVPEFVRQRIQSQLSSNSTVDRVGKGNSSPENHNRFSLPAQHSTYVDSAPITMVDANNNGHATPVNVTNRLVSNHSASPSSDNMRELQPGKLHDAPSGKNSGWVENSVSVSQQRDSKGAPSQSKQHDDTVVRRRAVYWQKFISQQQKPANFPKMSNGSFDSGDD